MKLNKTQTLSLLIITFSSYSNASSDLASIRNIPDSVPESSHSYEAKPDYSLPLTDVINNLVEKANDADTKAKMETHSEARPELYREENDIGSSDYDCLQALAVFSARSMRISRDIQPEDDIFLDPSSSDDNSMAKQENSKYTSASTRIHTKDDLKTLDYEEENFGWRNYSEKEIQENQEILPSLKKEKRD